MNEKIQAVVRLSDSSKSSSEIALIVGLSRRYVSRIQKNMNLPRLQQGSRRGEKNHQFQSGKHIDFDGYVIVRSPPDHPQARKSGQIYEHRLVMERKLNRHLTLQEVVDHIDGLTLHNASENLRLFPSNAHHLKATITGKPHATSPEGKDHILRQGRLPEGFQPIDTYRMNKERGDVRLRAILRSWLILGKGNPYLSGSSQWLEKAGIDWSCHSSLKRALADLNSRWFEGHPRL